ncbi:MAG: CDP-diacylglycerol--glycerol-3-phosphate 3-phosphatidyltransferase [Alphaproteobacteria bacterium]|nr:CDP-diacylglycerol--glycerol-3-phosphate 3-phosphatidyltransferase [Alphaproteobacteria bacterium]MDE1968084.1 CDP-diacylglycerol--glycerol-3-phosphate 3-phosphatidyltransferase [Alphaproteobacteria bacterium]
MLTTLPNLLTLSRIVAIPLVIATFYAAAPLGPWLGCVIFSLAAVTDWLDGRLARMWQQQSELGRFLDPVADKLLVATTLFMLATYDRLSTASILPALVILTREIMVSGLREHLAGLRVGMPVSKLAKWKTFIQMLAIGFLLIGDAGPAAIHVRAIGEVLLWLAAVLTVKTGYDYLRAGLMHINRPAPSGASIKTAKPSAT